MCFRIPKGSSGCLRTFRTHTDSLGLVRILPDSQILDDPSRFFLSPQGSSGLPKVPLHAAGIFRIPFGSSGLIFKGFLAIPSDSARLLRIPQGSPGILVISLDA